MSQKTDNLIKLALVFFVSLLSFSIGTYVGKKYSDNQHKLAALEPNKEVPVKTAAAKKLEFVSEEAQSDEAVDLPTGNVEELTNAAKPAALTDSEVAKLAEEFASEEAQAENKIVNQVATEEKPIKTISGTAKTINTVPETSNAGVSKQNAQAYRAQEAQVKQVATRPEVKSLEKKLASIKGAEVTDVSTPAETREPASFQPQAEGPIHYTVQIGSFPTQAEAEKMTKALVEKGYKTSFLPAKVNGQIWYRVNVGLFGTIREAQDYKKEFLEKTKMSSAIVQRVQN